MHRREIAAVILASLLTATVSAQQSDAKKLKDQLTGDAKGAASANPQCKLFTVAEISTYVSSPLGPGENAGGGAGCMWSNDDDNASAIVSVVSERYFPEPNLVKGFRRLPDVGTRGWVAPDSGWSAGAVVQGEAIIVVISGKKATEASAVTLLKEVIKRRKK